MLHKQFIFNCKNEEKTYTFIMPIFIDTLDYINIIYRTHAV